MAQITLEDHIHFPPIILTEQQYMMEIFRKILILITERPPNQKLDFGIVRKVTFLWFDHQWHAPLRFFQKTLTFGDIQIKESMVATLVLLYAKVAITKLILSFNRYLEPTIQS